LTPQNKPARLEQSKDTAVSVVVLYRATKINNSVPFSLREPGVYNWYKEVVP
jgi:hypothetical protein